MKKILTFIFSKDIKITADIIGQINLLLSINIGIDNFDKISVIVDNYKKQEELMAIAQIIACTARICQSEIPHSYDINPRSDSPKNLVSDLEKFVLHEISKSNTRYIIIISSSQKIFSPNKIQASMADFRIGEVLKFESIFAQ